ncbi:GMC family oxidoreductase [Tsuneonella sp. CC-YZS046]|uniref:GMC family oxidoreductase n=1 Tax=Tsuneonella sp. CC-YZS046 TaxID=3042152 RepID=UPI002D77B270|nr:GMC family oxidoreductase [Tsuneonella sp. CC-YZS046]WRO65864.1 GMC family oxidoreductase [Tsuneonella sp. CC-YZS046]
MHIDLEKTELDELDTPICVIGAGAAGIALTRRLLDAGQTVTLLESGGLDYEQDIADLNAGENVGEAYYQLEHSRLRFFGGTTAIWGGRLAELDPVDFEKRGWVPHSGWPITRKELEPYYKQARKLFGIPAEGLDEKDLGAANIYLPEFDPGRIRVKHWYFDNRSNRFTFDSCRDLERHPRCTVITHATVTAIEADPHAGRITSLCIQSLSRRLLTLRARVFVLAAGGIENPRLLLASRSVMKQGLGNAYDLVGRFFMEHPHARGGRLDTDCAWKLLRTFGRRHRLNGQQVAALITPSETRQAEKAILNTSLTLAPRQPANKNQFWGMRAYNRLKHDLAPTRKTRNLWLHAKKAAAHAQLVVDPLRPWLLHKLNRVELALLVRGEQAPNPDSRITLQNDDRDSLGIPRVRLDWRFSELDIHSVDMLVADLGRETERLGLGRIEPAEWLSGTDRRWKMDMLVSAHPYGGFHHMGTTRMADDPRQGVTDRQGRVHGIANLYVAGSSLFPTSGWANPTLTIVALALRTADHIAGRMDRGGAPEIAEKRLEPVS